MCDTQAKKDELISIMRKNDEIAQERISSAKSTRELMMILNEDK